MDGTLVSQDFADAVWLDGLPRLYAEERGMDFDEARKYVIKEYEKVGNEAIEWYDVRYWFHRFGIEKNWHDLLFQYEKHLRVYPEVSRVLEKLGKKYDPIIISNAAREFIQAELEMGGLSKKFSHIFSAVSDFKETKKEGWIYLKICEILGIEPREMNHIGDNWDFDYLVPTKMGIKAFYLDRKKADGKGEKNGNFIIKSLEEIEELL